MLEYIISLSRYTKRILAIIIDIGLCIICTWLAFYLRLEQFIKINETTILAAEISVLLAIPIFWFTGLYKIILRFAGSSILFKVFASLLIYSFLYFVIISIYGIQGVPRSIGVIQPMLFF